MWTVVLPVFGAGAGWWLTLCAFESIELGRIIFAVTLALVGALGGAFGAYAVIRHEGASKRRAVIVATIGGIAGLIVVPLETLA